MSDTPITSPSPSEPNQANTTPSVPQPMSWEEQKALYGELVQKTERTADDQDFLEAVGMAFVLDDLFSEEEPPDAPPEGSCHPHASSEKEAGK
jgi:hypothetical protein